MILVTGASGFLGGELVKQLVRNGKRVRIIRRPDSNLSYLMPFEPHLEILEGDILDIPSLEDAMTGVDQVYHSAALISYDSASHDLMYKVNVEGTANVVNAALKMQVKKLLHVSSIAALGAKPGPVMITESAKWEKHPYNTYYGITKMRAEREVFRGIMEGLPAVIINPGIIVGIGHDEHKATMRVFKKIAAGKLPFYMRGTNGFVDVEDVARAAIQLMDSAIRDDRFILVSGNWSFEKYFNTAADHLGAPHAQYEVKPWLGSLLCRADWLRSKLLSKKRTLTKENLAVMLEDFNYSSDKIRQALGFEFKPLERSISEIANTVKHGTVK